MKGCHVAHSIKETDNKNIHVFCVRLWYDKLDVVIIINSASPSLLA